MPDASPHHRPATTHPPEGNPGDRHGGPLWDALYAGTPRWDIGRPQPAFQTLAASGAIAGRVLDVGCGTGEHVLMCAALGLDATGIDLAATAISPAEDKARRRGLHARFLRHDACRLGDLNETFDTVLDSGLFHIVDDPGDRSAYLDGVHRVLRPAGRYFMLCFSNPGTDPRARHLTRDELTGCFAERWHIDAIEPATLDSRTDPDGIPAWLVALTRP